MASKPTGNLQDDSSVTKISCITEPREVKIRYTWTIRKFSSYMHGVGDYIESSTFSARGDDAFRWRLRLYPGGVNGGAVDWLSLGIQLISPNKPEVTSNCSLAIINTKGEKTNEFPSTMKIVNKIDNWIGNSFWLITRNNLMVVSKELLLPDDNLTILCELSLVTDYIKFDGQFNVIKDPELESHLSRNLGDLFDSEHFYDVLLVVGETTIKAHKAILAACSPVFATMFQNDMQGMTTYGGETIRIEDVKYEVLREMVWFIYTGRAPNLDKMAADLLVAADKYALKRLRVMCEEALCKNLSVETAADALVLAELHLIEKLKALTLNFINMNVKDVMATEGWRRMAHSHPQVMGEVFGNLVGQLK